MSETKSLQDIYGPKNACFGCGPANAKGLQIKSFAEGDFVVAEFLPEPHHQAFEGIINGGIIGTILDCHMNWAACWHLKQKNELESVPYTVTAKFTVELTAPTPAGVPLYLSAWVRDSSNRRAEVEATLSVDDTSETAVDGRLITAKGSGTFVSVNEGHPAYGRW